MEPRRSATSRENVCEAGGGRSFARVPRGWAVRPRRAAGAVPGESRRPWWARRRPGGASARRAGDAGCAPGHWRLRSSTQDASPPLRCGGRRSVPRTALLLQQPGAASTPRRSAQSDSQRTASGARQRAVGPAAPSLPASPGSAAVTAGHTPFPDVIIRRVSCVRACEGT